MRVDGVHTPDQVRARLFEIMRQRMRRRDARTGMAFLRTVIATENTYS
jgi:hypothetical protein